MGNKGKQEKGPAFTLACIGLMIISLSVAFAGVAGADGLVDNDTVEKPVDLWFEPLSYEFVEMNGEQVVAVTGNIHPMNPEWSIDLYEDGQYLYTMTGINTDTDPSVTYYFPRSEGKHEASGKLSLVQEDQYDPVPKNNTFKVSYTYGTVDEMKQDLCVPSVLDTANNVFIVEVSNTNASASIKGNNTVYLEMNSHTEQQTVSGANPSAVSFAKSSFSLQDGTTVVARAWVVSDINDPNPGNNEKVFDVIVPAVEPEPVESEPSIVSVDKEVKDKKCGKTTSKVNVFSVKALMSDGLFLPQGSNLMAACDGSGWIKIGSEQLSGVFVCTAQNYFPAAKLSGNHVIYFKVVMPDGRDTGVWKESFEVSSASIQPTTPPTSSSLITLKKAYFSGCGKKITINAVIDLPKDATGVAFYMKTGDSTKAVLIGGPTKKTLKAGCNTIHMDVTKHKVNKSKPIYVYMVCNGVKSSEVKVV